MKSKTTNKKPQSSIKVEDLKPKKDPKAGLPPDPCGPRGAHGPSTLPAIQ